MPYVQNDDSLVYFITGMSWACLCLTTGSYMSWQTVFKMWHWIQN